MSDCPCASQLPYVQCCAPFHKGEREAPDPQSLMRSRFSAFAKKNHEYLWRTLHADHEDRARSKDQALRALRDACVANRYLGLRILEAPPPGEANVAQVLFAAKVFHLGRDLSFIECSDFAREAGAWRYVGGEGAACPFDPSRPMTIAEFLGRAR